MAGAGYKLFNTGDVLTAAQVNTYLMEQTVMVFADAAARTTALTGIVSEGMISYLKDTNAVEVYNGSAWVASDDPNAIQNTIVDAKGDLISATAADTPARLPVGNNGETLVADSSATTGLRWQGNFAAGKNKIINGDFNIWQRGTTFTNRGAAGYSADRFFFNYVGTFTGSISRQSFTPGTAPVSGYESRYFARIDRTNSTSISPTFYQKVEGVNTLAGQAVTFSFWAKADTNRTVSVNAYQSFGSGGGSAAVDTSVGNASLTTSWQRFTFTITVPSISGKTIGTGNDDWMTFYFSLPDSTTFTIDFWGLQLEAGSVATAFQTATGTLAGELAACQRYYYMHANALNDPIAYGGNYSATVANCYVKFPVSMRTAPTLSATSGTNYYSFTRNGGADLFNSLTLDVVNTNGVTLYNNTEISGTAGDAGYFAINNASGSVAFSAEL